MRKYNTEELHAQQLQDNGVPLLFLQAQEEQDRMRAQYEREKQERIRKQQLLQLGLDEDEVKLGQRRAKGGDVPYTYNPQDAQNRRSIPAEQEEIIQTTPRPRQRVRDDDPPHIPRKKRRRMRFHPLFWLGVIGICIVGFASIWLMLSSAVTSVVDHWNYGSIATATFDVSIGDKNSVGNSDDPTRPSEFIATTLKSGEAVVIEFPAGDVKAAKIYVGPMLIGDNGQPARNVPMKMSMTMYQGKTAIKLQAQSLTWYLVRNGPNSYTVVIG